MYGSRDPHGDEEIEFAENLFDSLVAALLAEENRTEFGSAGGLKLCIELVR